VTWPNWTQLFRPRIITVCRLRKYQTLNNQLSAAAAGDADKRVEEFAKER